MKQIEISRQRVNMEALQEELANFAGDDFIGLSTRPGRIIAFMQDESDRAVIEAVRSRIINHDATQLSAAQQAAQMRRLRLVALRQQHETALDTDAYAAQVSLIRQLAARVAWLEQEVRHLQKLDTQEG